jgi:N-acetylated-alpha-linked acidic dipeptidase
MVAFSCRKCALIFTAALCSLSLADVGFTEGTPYPDGPWGPEWGVQRGSIWNGNGDPQTPGFPSVPYADRLNWTDINGNEKTYNTPIPAIPCLPLSWGDAQHILRRIGGVAIPPAQQSTWVGGLNLTYAIGPGPVVVDLNVFLNYTVQRIFNVHGVIEGDSEPDRMIMIGNHRDAWTFGAADPNSGTAALIEVAHGLGNLLATGWKPKRTIQLCNWDAEEWSGQTDSHAARHGDVALVFSHRVCVIVVAQGSDWIRRDGRIE